MNFQQIQQVKGQKDSKNWPLKLDMYAVLDEIKSTYFNTNQKQCTDVVITDTNNEKHKVTLFGDAPAAKCIGTRQGFRLSAFDGTYTDKNTGQSKSYIGYSGFWVENPPQNEPQNPPQARQNPPQSTNSGSDDATTKELFDVLYQILAAIKDLQPFEKKYDLGKDPDFPNPPGATQPEDDTAPF